MKEKNNIKTGIVKFFNSMRGFGVIKDQESDEEFMVSINNLINSIKDNDLVEFEVQKCKRRMTAVKVRVI